MTDLADGLAAPPGMGDRLGPSAGGPSADPRGTRPTPTSGRRARVEFVVV
jgi:hypothetical protein